MKKTSFAFPALLILTCASAFAQQPFDDDVLHGDMPVAGASASPAPGVRPFSTDDRRYDSPKEAVRRKAEWKSAQRQARIAAMKWLGYCPLRPPTSPLPFMGAPSTWIGGAHVHYRWPGVYYPLGVAASDHAPVRR